MEKTESSAAKARKGRAAQVAQIRLPSTTKSSPSLA